MTAQAKSTFIAVNYILFKWLFILTFVFAYANVSAVCNYEKLFIEKIHFFDVLEVPWNTIVSYKNEITNHPSLFHASPVPEPQMHDSSADEGTDPNANWKWEENIKTHQKRKHRWQCSYYIQPRDSATEKKTIIQRENSVSKKIMHGKREWSNIGYTAKRKWQKRKYDWTSHQYCYRMPTVCCRIHSSKGQGKRVSLPENKTSNKNCVQFA